MFLNEMSLYLKMSQYIPPSPPQKKVYYCWNSFSVNYRISSYFCPNIKKQILDKCNKEFPICEIQDPEPVCKNDDQSLVYFNTPPKKQYAKRSNESLSRELLKQINSLTFIVFKTKLWVN